MASFWSTILFVSACKTLPDEQFSPVPPGPEPVFESSDPRLRRLTTSQYRNAIRTLLGGGLLFPSNLEPDVTVGGLQEVGASVTSISATGVVRYEEASYSLLEQFFTDEESVQKVIPCLEQSTSEADCATETVTNFGRFAWRRPLSETEITLLSDLILSVSEQSGDFMIGLEFGMAAILQSPHFLYRSEYGQGTGTLTDYEMASRLSFLLWNNIPDEPLLTAAQRGELSTFEGLSLQLERMLEDPRIIQGINQMFIDFFELYKLDDLVKDPFVFNHSHPDFGFSAREEILYGIYHIVLKDDADFRELLTSQITTVDLRLAALYDIPAPRLDGFGNVFLPESSGRRGLLGKAGILALHSHATSTSATLRGIFIRRKLLCQEILPAPADVNASLPEADASLPTLRERIAIHLEDESCAGCHDFVDPIGLGLENFDGIGRWRTTENDAKIDASGSLDGVDFNNAWELAAVISEHPDFGGCFAQHLFEYSTGHALQPEEEDYKKWLATSLAYDDWSFLEMIRTMVLSDSFRKVGAAR